MKIDNVAIYGFEQSITAAGLPMTKIGAEAQYDINRAKKLGTRPAGSGHDNFLKGVIVQFDLLCSQVMNLQLLRYNFMVPVSSQSKMHKITTVKRNNFNEFVAKDVLEAFIANVESFNRIEEELDSDERKLWLKRLVYSCPGGLEMTARYSTNYMQLKTIYNQRRGHKLDEWQTFCDWIEELPEFKSLTGI